MALPGLAKGLILLCAAGFIAGCAEEKVEEPTAESVNAANEAASMWTDEQKSKWKDAAAANGMTNEGVTAPAAPEGPDVDSKN